jgi:transcriptional regulator with XRE-family HTH domain
MTTTPIAAVLGANCRRIRTNAQVTQDELARAARQVGLRWTASKVRDFEVGRNAPTFATVLALTAALDTVTTGEPVRLADLVVTDGDVTVTDDFELDGDRLADFCSGGTWERSSADGDIDWRESVIDWPKVLGLTEQRVAAELGVSPETLGDTSLRLWETTFSAKRDQIAGPDAKPQRKGWATRQLKAALQKELTRGNN